MVSWLSSQKMETVKRVPLQDEDDYTSHSNDTLKKVMNPMTLLSTMNKYWEKVGFVALVWQPVSRRLVII